MDDSYSADVLAWRERYETRLLAEDGWLAVTGLHWLEEGRNSVGTESGNDIFITCSTGPSSLGTFSLDAGNVTFEPAPGVLERFPELAAFAGRIVLASHGSSERLRVGDCSLVVLRRGDRFGIRVYDKHSPERQAFKGVNWFPIEPRYRLTARFEAYPEPKPMPLLNMIGQVVDAMVPGEIHFELGETSFRLLPTLSGDKLFIVFKDGTSGNETYAAARFLMAERPADGRLTLDFNRAYHPPCAHTPHATCPLPFPENRLPIRIPAGERLPQ